MLEIAIDSVFHLQGRGTVLAGHVQSGRIAVGDAVEICSDTAVVRSVVAGLEAHGLFVTDASSGTDIGVLLGDFQPERLGDGFQRDDSGGWRAIGVRIQHAPKPWWRFW